MWVFPKRVTDLANELKEEKEWVRLAGFQSILEVKFVQVDRFFLSWLSSRWDHQTHLLRIREDYHIKVDDEMVGRILGLPYGEDKIEIEEPNVDDIEFEMIKGSYHDNEGIKHRIVSEALENDKSDKMKFLRSFVLFVFGNLFCTTLTNKISPTLCWLLKKRHISKPLNWNWSKFVLDWMVKQHQESKDGKDGVRGCAVVLMVCGSY